MKANDAVRIAARFYENHADYLEAQVEEATDAVRAYVLHGVPSGADYGVVDSGDGLPLILALAEERLYAIGIERLSEHAASTVRCRALRFTAQNCSIRIYARFSGNHAFGFGVRATWAFVVNDPGGPLEFEIPGQIDSDGEPNVAAEFGLNLAQTLGVTSPRPGRD